MAIKVICDRCGDECRYEDGYSTIEPCGKDSYERHKLYLCRKCSDIAMKAANIDNKDKEAKK